MNLRFYDNLKKKLGFGDLWIMVDNNYLTHFRWYPSGVDEDTFVEHKHDLRDVCDEVHTAFIADMLLKRGGFRSDDGQPTED